MNLSQAKSADRWLIRWNRLANKYSNPDLLTDYHKQILGDWGDHGIPEYYGQV